MPDPLHPTPNTPCPSPMPRLLIVEDNETIRTQLKWALAKDYEVFVAEDRKTALEIFENAHPAVVTLDLGLPPLPQDVEEGFQTMEAILQRNSVVKVIVMTGREEREHALRAISQGAYDYFCKPIQVEELKVVLRRAFHIFQLEQENRELLKRLGNEAHDGMLGASSQLQEICAAIRKVATTDAPILITGESGTGKELVARAIHRQSLRKNCPFVTINCGAIPETLLESELFGHEKGAFTGAHIQRKGRFEMTQGGCLFLDEIGELSLALQVKLLRFLQEHRIERVGGREGIDVDARVMAATNVDLKLAMRDGRFREDLYYRLGVVVISVPPLRDRQGDVHLLAKAILERYSEEMRKKIVGFTASALRALESHSWPGNVRELENRIKRAVIMAEGSRVTAHDLELEAASEQNANLSLREAREALERDFIRRALTRNKGRFTLAAADLGISRPTLYELMERLGIK